MDQMSASRTTGSMFFVLLSVFIVEACRGTQSTTAREKDQERSISTTTAREENGRTVRIDPRVDTDYPRCLSRCQGHVTPQSGPHINWRSCFTSDEPDKVRSHYMKIFGRPPRLLRPGEMSWSAVQGPLTRNVTVAPPLLSGPWKSCGPPPPRARAAVLTSSRLKQGR